MAWLVKRSYTVTLPDGSKERRRCETWSIQFRDAAGKVRAVPGYTDKGATKAKAAKLEAALARGEQGLVDVYKVHRDRPLSEHVADWLADRRTAGKSAKYLAVADKRLAILLAGCGWKVLADVESNSFLRWRDRRKGQRVNGTRKDLKGTGAATLNQYLDTARAMLNWCVDQKRLAANTLADVDKVQGEARRIRRALTDEQVTALLAVAPADRKLVYRFALATGLRRRELRLLQWGDLGLRSTRPYVQLRAETTKARRGDKVPLPPSLAEDLRKEKPTDVSDADPVFPRVPSLVWWKLDLAAAKIPYRDAQGRAVDFHAARKTLCSRMHRSGVPLVTAKLIMRHTDVKLTAVDYADDVQLAGDALPELLPAPAQPESQAGVGA